jgi:lipopolysaccharide export system protein LptC
MSSPTADPRPHFAGALPVGLQIHDIERRQRALAKWRRHSQWIRLLRRLLPAASIGLLVVLIGWVGANALFWKLTGSDQGGRLSIRMLRPQFQGRDGNNRPYQLSADSAVRDDVDTQKITMEGPVFVLGSGPQDQTHIQAQHGVYREDTKILILTHAVKLRDAHGNRFNSENAVIDTQKNNVDGDTAVDGDGPLGQIAASSYAVRDGGARVIFTGHVKARIQKGGAAARPAPTPAQH